MKLRIPDGQKLWGANVVPKTGQGWRELFLEWDWAGWLKPQIDYMVGNGIGCNCIRLIGCNEGVYNGIFSQSYHDTRLIQMIDYCMGLGAYFYVTGGGVGVQGVPTGTPSVNNAMADIFATTFLQAQSRPNVIGIDLVQEVTESYGIGNAATLAQLVKARGVTLPITCSTSEPYTAGSGGTRLNVVAAQAAFDFLDVHFYPSDNAAPPLNLFDSTRAAWPKKDLLIGEFGTSQGGDSVYEQSMGMAVLNIANSGDPGIRGALVWGASDQDNIAVNSGNCWGVYAANFAIRQSKANLLRRYTGGSLSRAGAYSA